MAALALGSTGLWQAISAYISRRRAGSSAVDLRRLTDEAAANTIKNLEGRAENCERRLAGVSEQLDTARRVHEKTRDELDALRRTVRVLFQRDTIMQHALKVAGVALPAMPKVPWPPE